MSSVDIEMALDIAVHPNENLRLITSSKTYFFMTTLGDINSLPPGRCGCDFKYVILSPF